MATPKPVTPDNGDDSGSGEPDQVKEPKIEYVHSRQVRVTYDKAWLASEEDVDRYVESLRAGLLDEVRKGKRVQI